MTSDSDGKEPIKRHSRMPFDSAVHMVRGGHAWTTELVDISATGILVERPEDWIGQEGDTVVLDLVIHDSLDIHVEAEVRRLTNRTIGLQFTRIPPEREREFWSLLGEYAHKTEPFK